MLALDKAGRPYEGKGTGSDSTVGLDPTDVIENPNSPSEPAGNDAALTHELIHADRAAHGRQDLTPDPVFDNAEERAATDGENGYMREGGFKWHRVDHGVTLERNP
jgi:hypothetical protein